jgi:4-hydroxybenzoyl-CoA thioesterase
MLTNRRTIHIEWGDCDPAGIVYYPRFFEWFDECTAALFEAAGLKKWDLVRGRGIVIPMVDTRSRFLIPSRFGDNVVVETAITRFGRSSFDVHHRMMKGADLAAECFETRVWTRMEPHVPMQMKAEPIPADVIQMLTEGIK